jgi:hypothetical protein
MSKAPHCAGLAGETSVEVIKRAINNYHTGEKMLPFTPKVGSLN